MAGDDKTPSSFQDDELPEEIPLTPELVEEEAIRGDFMLRWAAIFLAVLFGFSQISETRTLVHIRSGEQMRGAGFLPPRVDTMSFSAEGQPTGNVSWLFDHLVSLAWAAGGESGLTWLKVAIAAVIGWTLVHISVPGVPTWWNSICAVFAIVAFSADLAPITDIITLLGMVFVLKWIHEHREGLQTKFSWKLVAIVIVWCNLDPRAWIGVLTLVAYAIGCRLASQLDADNPDESKSTATLGTSFWLTVGFCTAALLANPFPLNSMFSAVSIYSSEYYTLAEQRPLSATVAPISFDQRTDYFFLISADAIKLYDHTQIAGLAAILIALVVLIMSFNRNDLGFVCMFLVLTVLAVYKAHELPVAALAAAVIAGTTAQRWYRRRFPQVYTTDSKELMFSRGGRAATVFAMTMLGFCIAAGRLPGHTPIGTGFERNLKTTIDTLGTQLADIEPEAKILHTRIEQGDLLIWHGRKSLVDSRIVPFGQPSDPNSVVARYTSILQYVLKRPDPPKDQAEQPEFERRVTGALKAIDDFAVTHIMPRFAPPGDPDYRTVETLSTLPEWVLVSIGPSAGFMKRIDADTPVEKRLDLLPPFGKMAFMDAKSQPAGRVEFAHPPDFYKTYIYEERPYLDGHLRLARHYLWLSAGQLQSIQQAITGLALSTLAVREINQSLAIDPQNPYAYRLLGVAYQKLNLMETALSGQTGETARFEMRFLQTVMALRQALTSNPDDAESWNLLFQEYYLRNRIELAAESLDRSLSFQKNETNDVDKEAELNERRKLLEELRGAIRENGERLQDTLKSRTPAEDPAEEAQQLIVLAETLRQSGYDKSALELLQENSDSVRQSPAAQILQGRLMLICGQVEEGNQQLSQMAAVATEQPEHFVASMWHFPAAVSFLSAADYSAAIETWNTQLGDIARAGANPEPNMQVMVTMPLVSETALLPTALLSSWPVTHMNSLRVPLQGVARSLADARFLIALCHLEEGNLTSAEVVLKSIISECGESQNKQLAAFYLSMMGDEKMKFIDEYSLVEWEELRYPGEPDIAPPPEQKQPAQQ
ncbi:MAG: hypothetical protein JNL58_29300 [Planctomyces sp.]|nr:hypothetical protein [Planctomyces sp.]